MADIRLSKPAAGASESVQCAPDARFVFDFPTTDATLARDGDNLNISFQDGSQLQLQGFYQEYNGENLPSFNIDGTEVAAADFFQAMNEPDLMPAAGPGTGTVANGARFHEWGDSALTGGILHLDGLDWGFSRAFEWEDHPNAVGYDDDGWRGAANTVPDLDVPVAPERPYDPRNPGDDPNNPASPQNPGGYIPNTHGASIVVDEDALAKGSGQHVLHGTHDFGSFVADVHAERGGSIELSFGGKVVTLEIPQDGSLRIAPTGDASFANVNGVDVRILGAESAGDGKWVVRYEYRLDDHIEHDKLLGQDTVRYDGEGIAITVTDGSGDVARGRLTVEVHDDVPVLNSVSFAQPVVVDERDEEIRVNLDGLLTGADEEGAVLTVDVNGTVFVGHKGAGGQWTFDEGNDPEAGALRFENGEFIYTRPVADLDGDETNTYTFTATITDGDNDSVSRTNSITTIAKPKFNRDPDPTPEPKDPDPEGGEPAELGKQISSVVTDDSWVDGGTEASAATPQTLADEPGSAEGTDGTESVTNIANGSFSLTMNGRPITVTIAGEEGAAITLEFSADGKLESIDGPKDEAGHIQLASKEGYGLLEVVDTKVGDDNTITVNYTFTQTKAYEEHDDHNDRNELAYSADSFTVTLEDDLGQPDEGSIRVSIRDDAPVLENVAITSAGKALLDDVRTIKGTVTALEGADTDGATLVVEVNGTTFTGVRGQGEEWTFSPSAKDGESFSIEGQSFTYTRPTADVGKADGHKANEYTFNFTLKDGDGDAVRDFVSVKTVEKPKFEEDPHKTPGPEDGELGKQISNVFTDDSWVEGGTEASAATPQTQADEPGSAEGTDGTESVTNIARGAFSLTMNGQPITVTIKNSDSEGRDITLEFDWAGNLINPEDKALADFGTATGANGYGHLVVTGTKPDPGTNTLTISYIFTQTQAYTSHGVANDPNDLAYSVDSFKVKLKDALDQEDEGSIRVSIYDDAPVVTAPDAMGFTWTEDGATVTDPAVQGTFDYKVGADKHPDGADEGLSYTLQLNGATDGEPYYAKNSNGETIKAKTKGGEWQDVQLKVEADGSVTAFFTDDNNDKHNAFTLTIDAAGKVTMNPVDDIAIKHPDQDGAANKDVTLTGVQRVLTVTDVDGDATSASQAITITIKDTAAEFITPSAQNTDYNSEELGTALSIDFANATLGTEIKEYKRSDGEILPRGFKAGDETINIFGTHVAYNMTADGTVILLEDQALDFGQYGNMDKDLQLNLTPDKGLGVVSKAQTIDDATELCVGYGVSNYKDSTHPELSRTKTDFHSEGVVIEPANGTVNYGLTLTLSDFGEGERAIVAFYLTPQHNNDNSVVRYVELHAGENGTHYTYEGGKYVISVPDGFTKCIIAPIPTKEELADHWNNDSTTPSGSQFAIAKIEFTQPSVFHTGTVEWEANVDGVQSLTWDWSENSKLAEHFAGGVYLPDTLGTGTYEVKFQADNDGDNAFKAILVNGPTGAYSQNGRTLFTATLDVDLVNGKAEWKIDQFYKFTLVDKEKDPSTTPIEFTITDGDGTQTTNFLEDGTRQPYLVNLALTSVENRFDNAELGAYDKNWGGYACRDNIYDVLQGEGVNDLMYGRGGNDIMFGDNIGGKEGFNEFATQVLGTPYMSDYTKYDDPDNPRGKEHSDLRYEPGDNEPIVNDIYKKLDGLIKDETYDELDDIVAKVEELAESQGKDALFGGVGNDILFGGAGDDYLVGTGNLDEAKGSVDSGKTNPGYHDNNMLFGGSGRDILVFNKDDVILDGGRGIDILLMGKADSKAYNPDKYGAALNRLLLHKNEDMPIVRNVELLLVSLKTDFVEQLGITSQESLQAYGIIISGDIVQLNQNMWKSSELHSSPDDSYPYDRYVSKDGALQLDVIREGVRLEDYHGHLFDTTWRGTNPDPDPDNEASVMSLMNEDSAVVMASDAPEEGESVTQAAFDPAQEEGPTPEQPAPEATPADIVETPESFLARVESLGGKEEDIRFGTDGGDYLDSVDDSYVFADAGDDFIVYDPTDYLIDGGSGIDFLLSKSSDPDHSLAAMLDNWEQNGAEKGTPMVHDVEVMLKGVDLSLQNMEDLAEKYGFEVKHVEGKDILELKEGMWEKQTTEGPATEENGAPRTTTYKFKGGSGENGEAGAETTVTLETTLTAEPTDSTETIVLTQIVTTSQG